MEPLGVSAPNFKVALEHELVHVNRRSGASGVDRDEFGAADQKVTAAECTEACRSVGRNLPQLSQNSHNPHRTLAGEAVTSVASAEACRSVGRNLPVRQKTRIRRKTVGGLESAAAAAGVRATDAAGEAVAAAELPAAELPRVL